MSTYRPGMRLRLPDGEPVVIWDAAPGTGCYWAHRITTPNRDLVLIQVRQNRHDAHPFVVIREDPE